MSKGPRSPQAKALEEKQFRRQIVPSGKVYDRKAEKKDQKEEGAAEEGGD